MASVAPDPLQDCQITGFARDLRAGKTTATAVTRAFLDRIEALDDRLGSYQHVAPEQALAAAQAIDGLVAAGTDLGPLMGVPVAVKDIYAVEGMPLTNGSLYDASHITGPEGPYVRRLRSAGCVILGKTRTVEFALGANGVNEARGTPWNPWDMQVHRAPGGSSSGSGVATAAGLCAFAIGSDTGGSVRIPACFNGIFGHKTTIGLYPTDGVFPLSPTLDTIGPLTRSARDAALVHTAMTGEPVPDPRPLAGIRLGLPTGYFSEDCEPEVAGCMEAAVASLRAAGVEIVDVDIPDPSEREWLFPAICPPELLAALGENGFRQARPNMDPVTGARAEKGFEITGVQHAAAIRRHHELSAEADRAMEGVDAWIGPTCQFLPMAVADLADPAALTRSFLASRNTQPSNLFRQCAVTTPIQQFGSRLPVGFQIMCRNGADAHALSLAMAIEAHFGPSGSPDLSML